MARCGCTGPVSGVAMTASDCIGVSGTGSEADPFSPFLVLSADDPNLVECRDDGLFVPSWEAVQTVASVAAITLPATGKVFSITGTTTITSIVATGNDGRLVTLVFRASLTVTDGSNLKLVGSFSATADDTLQLACDGTNWHESGRSAS